MTFLRDDNTLCQRLKFGLNKLMNKDIRISKHFSFDVRKMNNFNRKYKYIYCFKIFKKKIQLLNEQLFELNQRYLTAKMDNHLLKNQFQSFTSENSTVKITKSKIKFLEDAIGDLKKKVSNSVFLFKFRSFLIYQINKI